MNCNNCGRELQEDARYCDFCGTELQPEEKVLNKRLLVTGVLASLGITLVITLVMMGFGVPLFIGGLFLPFFFTKKSRQIKQ